ncbi:MAG: hypothetical protein C5B51_31030 [Terriglobia bacterium]|nr:MAG: hypothetical protein C5B51_31030 [Terriglobia bacterium]
MSAQTLQISPNPLVMTAQANVGASANLSLTSSGGVVQVIASVNPGAAWLHVSPATQVPTPATLAISTDPLAAGTYSGSLNIASTVGTFTVPVTLNVSVIGVSPGQLNFSYVLGGSTPSPQNITVTLPQGVTAQVSKTGTWLNYSITGGNSTPGIITVTIDPAVAQTLTAGVYPGSITVTPTVGSNLTPATVQVTLTVTTTPQVTISPSSLTFNFQLGGTNNQVSQTLQLTADAQGIANFAISPTVSWLGVNPSVGSIPPNGTASITVTLIGQPSPNAGTYSGSLALSTTTTQSIPVTVNESPNPYLNLPSAPLSFTFAIGGASPAAQTVTPTSTGAPATQVAYNVTANQPWLVVPQSATTPNPVSISVNPANLAPGNYSGIVTFTNTSTGTSQSLPVTLKVTNNPAPNIYPSTLTYVYQVGQIQPASQNVTVGTTTGAPLNYTATTSTPWIVLTGHTSGTTTDGFTVSVNTAAATVGIANAGLITITTTDVSTGAPAGTATVAVTLYVSSSALLQVNPPQQPIAFTAPVGTQAITQTVTLSSTSSTDQLTFSIPPPNSSWLFLPSPVPTTSLPGSNVLTLTAVPGNLSAGVYFANVVINATGPGGAAVLDSPYTLPVVLVLTSGSLAVSPASLTFSQTAGGPAPAAQTVNVTSSPAGLSYVISTNDSGLGWLSASSPAGVAPGAINVSVDASRLSPGNYSGRVIVTSANAGNSPLTIPVTLQVTSGTISASPTPLVFTIAAGSTTSVTQNVTVSGSPGALNFGVASSIVGSGSWLSVTPTSGTTPATLQVSINPTGLAANTYTGSVTITSAGATGSPLTIPVTVNIVPPQTLTVTPAALTFNYVLSQTAPASQTVQVQSSGGAVPISVATNTNNTGTWLQATPATGTTPATLTVAINPQGLAAGNYTGTVSVASPNSLAAAVIQVTLSVTQTPKPVITGIRNAASGFLSALSPGEMVSIYGTNVGPTTGVNGVLASNGRVATTLGGTRVLFDNVEAPIIFTRADQTSVVVPYEVAGRPTTSVRVEFNGTSSDAVIYNITATAPGIFTLNQQGTGPGAIRNAADFSVNGPNAPAPKGGYVSIYMTGEGATTPPGVTGAVSPADGSGNKKPLATVTATIGGIPAFVQYAGSAPGTVNGFTQVNLRIPDVAPSGVAVPVVITFTTGGVSTSTQPGVTLAVQ